MGLAMEDVEIWEAHYGQGGLHYRHVTQRLIQTAIANYRLVDRIIHFLTRRSYIVNWGWPWKMWRYGRPIMGKGDYIIGT